MLPRRSFTTLALFALGTVAAAPAFAGLALTTDGVNLGFTLTTFVSGYNGSYGPLAQGILPNGNVITGSAMDTTIYVFSDIDNQVLADAVATHPYTCETGNCNFAMATAGGEVYGAQAFGGVYYHFASDGSFTPIPNLQTANLFGSLGMWPDPANGHLIAASNQGLVEIDPVVGTFRVINGTLFPDGVTVTPDGSVAYVENGGTIQSYDIATGALIHTFFTGHSPDGTGVITGGTLDGRVVVNDNDGTVGLLDPTKADGDPLQFIIIASGGTRGDFVSPDLNNGTLFLSQNEQVARLSCGQGCVIGAAAPEPSAFLLLAPGLAIVAALRRKVARRA